MADPEKTEKFPKFRQFWKGYGRALCIVVIVVMIYNQFAGHDIIDNLQLLRERPVSGILLLVFLLLAAGGLYVLEKLVREYRKEREKRK